MLPHNYLDFQLNNSRKTNIKILMSFIYENCLGMATRWKKEIKVLKDSHLLMPVIQ